MMILISSLSPSRQKTLQLELQRGWEEVKVEEDRVAAVCCLSSIGTVDEGVEAGTLSL